MYKKLLIWLVILVVSFSAAGCGSSSDKSASIDYNGYSHQGSEAPMQSESVEVETATDAKTEVEVKPTFTEVKDDSTNKSLINMSSVSQKIIFTGQVNLETLDFEKTKNDLCQYITSIGGFTQNSSVNGSRIGQKAMKRAEYVFRIPKDKYNQSFIDLREFGTVVLEQSNGEDITEKYFDTEARLKTLKIQQERLQALLNKASKMEDILKIENQLQEILYQIESYTGSLKKWDSLVQYATLSVNISEVEKIKPIEPKNDGFFDRIVLSFKNSLMGLGVFLQDLVVFVAAAVPVIIPIGLICFLVYKFCRKEIKKYLKFDKNYMDSIDIIDTDNNDNIDNNDKK